MGEFTVHRVRFFHYMPSGICAMAFNRRTERLAVARTDGSVELYSRTDHFFQEKVVPGRQQRSIQALCWVGKRLFGAGLSGEIAEFDLDNLRLKFSQDAYGGPIWSIVCNPQGTHLAAGCEDGTVKLFEILEDQIRFERNMGGQKGRIISLAWHSSGTKIAAGMIDMIKVFDLDSGELRSRGSRMQQSQECVVWSVLFLSDIIVSGDSAGKVKMWDVNTGTLIKNHQVTEWDVLTLSVSQDETSLFAGTSEGTVVQFQLLDVVLGQEEKEWVRTRTFKNHTHDVIALAEADTVIISGGMDTQLVVRPLLDKLDFKSRDSSLLKILFPQRSLVSCAKKAGLLLFQYPTHLELWRLGDTEGHGPPGCILPVSRNPEKLLHLKIKGEDHVCCSAVAPCGEWIAYSTTSGIRLYRLQRDNKNVSITKVPKLPKVLRHAHQLCFSPDSSHLYGTTSSAVHVVALTSAGCKFEHSLKPNSCVEPFGNESQEISDGKFLASANSNSEIHIYNMHKLKAHCTVPVYRSGVSAMGIHPETNNLVIVHADHQIFEFSIEQMQYTDWSRRVQKEGLHHVWLERDTPVINVTFNPQNPNHVILHDSYMFCIIDQSLPLPDRKSQFHNQLTLKSLPEAERLKHSHAFKECKLYQPLLCVDMLENQSLVVVERPLLDITTNLPAPVRQKKFAT
uniref:Cirhin n=1 Tax=Denticeps clupeoides TaxID=299321 RepID=A0AAY4DRV7_9TELE